MNQIEVGPENMLGKRGQGLEIANNAHDDARYLMGAVLTGIRNMPLILPKTTRLSASQVIPCSRTCKLPNTRSARLRPTRN